MTNVVRINGHLSGEPDPEIISTLEYVLELARTGSVTGVCIAYVNADGSVGRSMYSQHNLLMMASIEILRRDVMDSHLSQD